jgi:hypothetical protein
LIYRLLSADAKVTIKLLPPCLTTDNSCSTSFNDAGAITMVNNESKVASSNGQPNIHTFEWRGYNFNDVNLGTNNILITEDGTYTYIIEATRISTGLSTYYRGSLQLY